MENIPMPEPVGPSCVEHDIENLHAAFLEIHLRIELHAKISFRHLRCPGRKADAVQETLAVAWQWFLKAVEKGKDVNEFVSALASYAVRHVRSGRRLVCSEKAKDVLSALAQQRHHFKVEPLNCSTRRDHETLYADPHGQDELDGYEERLRDNTVTPPPDAAAFRIDFPAWLSQLGPRNREIAQDMAMDLATQELARKYRVSPARISQMRREFWRDWGLFHRQPV
jgi:hypothetical protein